jgi:hypothetical protein
MYILTVSEISAYDGQSSVSVQTIAGTPGMENLSHRNALFLQNEA